MMERESAVASSSQAFSPTVNSLDFSYLQLGDEVIEGHLTASLLSSSDNGNSDESFNNDIQALYLQHNRLTSLSHTVSNFIHLQILDVSSNLLTEVSDSVVRLQGLKSFIAKNNLLNNNSLPKDFGLLRNLEVLNLSGNNFSIVAPQILELTELKGLYLGGNFLDTIPPEIRRLSRLEVLYLGGNNLEELPSEMGQLQSLQALILCENRLNSLPSSISQLRRLHSLALHKNCLTTLPPELVRLRGLAELSLRDNPLVVRFVRDMTYDPPSLLELAARTIKIKNITYNKNELPSTLVHYLTSAQRCVNPKCKGVYFDAHVEHIKFVDFCGKYRIPLLQYLCSPKCTTNPAVYTSSESDLSEDDAEIPVSRLKKVLLG